VCYARSRGRHPGVHAPRAPRRQLPTCRPLANPAGRQRVFASYQVVPYCHGLPRETPLHSGADMGPAEARLYREVDGAVVDEILGVPDYASVPRPPTMERIRSGADTPGELPHPRILPTR